MKNIKKNIKKLSLSSQRVKKSFILVFSLWALVILSIFGLYIGAGARQKITLVKRLDERSKLRAIATAGARRGILSILKDSTPEIDTFNESWANKESLFNGISLGLGKYEVYHLVKEVNSKNDKKIYGIVDEARKINVNKADLTTLRRLCKAALDIAEVDAQELAASIIDFIDKDSATSIPLGSGEKSYYTNIKYPYSPKDSDIEVMEELLLVKGMTKESLDILSNYITIHGDGKININTASYAVFYALGLDEKIATMIIEFRAGSDLIEGTDDDNVFTSITLVVPELSKHYSLSPSTLGLLNNVIGSSNLTVASKYFMIRSRSWLVNPEPHSEIVCVIDRSGKILSWREM